MTCTDHKCTRIIPLWSLLLALFSKLPARRRGTVRIQTGAYPRRSSNVRALFTHTQPTCPRLARTFSCTRAYTCHYNDTLQFRAGAPLTLREDPTSRRRPSSSSLLPSLGRRLRTHLSRSVSGNSLSSAPRRAIEFQSFAYFENKHRNRQDFRLFVIEDRGSIA